MKKLYELSRYLNPTDMIVVSFALFLSGLNIVYIDRIPQWPMLVLANFVVIILVYVVANNAKKKPGTLWEHVNKWYLIPLIFLTFKELYLMIKPIRVLDFDHFLIEVDRFLFGFDVTVELYAIAHPVLTELLQISYGTFFFLPIILGIEMLRKDREVDFRFVTFSVLFGFFLSFLGYFMLPAIGPRFHLHDFNTINIELPGLLLTNFLRDLVNAGESVTPGMINPQDYVQRDVFPSGHTQMTLIVMYLSYKLKAKSSWFLLPNGVLLIFSTMYLRYHYIIDVLGGVIFFLFTMWAGIRVYNWWMSKVGGQKFSYPPKN